jgi:16S rRNA (cytosine1402-N4)-methyltransferase
MDRSLAVTAANLLNGLTRDELTKLFQKYGEEQFARRVASAVVCARALKPFAATGDLVRVIKGSGGKIPARSAFAQRWRARHPATKVFQALRIAVNDEINNLRSALPQAFEILAKGGRVAVISFHSLEDREVKHFFKELADRGVGVVATKKPITPTVEEIERNPRVRSAKLRVVEKVKW